jgi:hypothetical protein
MRPKNLCRFLHKHSTAEQAKNGTDFSAKKSTSVWFCSQPLIVAFYWLFYFSHYLTIFKNSLTYSSAVGRFRWNASEDEILTRHEALNSVFWPCVPPLRIIHLHDCVSVRNDNGTNPSKRDMRSSSTETHTLHSFLWRDWRLLTNGTEFSGWDWYQCLVTRQYLIFWGISAKTSKTTSPAHLSNFHVCEFQREITKNHQINLIKKNIYQKSPFFWMINATKKSL